MKVTLQVLDEETCMDQIEEELSPKTLFQTQMCAGGERYEVRVC